MLSKLALKTIVAVLVGAAQSAWAEGDCSLSTLAGDFVMTGSGIPTEGSPPLTSAGVVMFDGNGNLSGRETRSTGGEITRISYNGTYTLDADCTGTVTVGAANWDMVLSKDGSEGVLIRSDPGSMITRNFKKR